MELFDFTYPNSWEYLKNSSKPIVLYGMGNGADKVLDTLSALGVRPAGVMASDAFARYQSFRGYTVQKQSDHERERGDFTVALCFGSSLPEVTSHIFSVARQHELIVPYAPVVGNVTVDGAFISANKDRIAAASALLADGRSAEVFRLALHFYYTGRLEYLLAADSEKDEAMREILRLKDESYLDLGAYRGDTVEEFLRFCSGYTSITAVEPNPKNFAKLNEYLKAIPNAAALNAAAADRAGTALVSRGAGRMASLSAQGGTEIPAVTVDSLNCSHTYIKADVEGYEAAVLRGAEKTLKARKPKLNIAAYHRAADLFDLILQIHSINPEYKIYLRKHPYIPFWDLNIYAV